MSVINEQNNFDKVGRPVIENIINELQTNTEYDGYDFPIKNELLLSKTIVGCDTVKNYIKDIIDGDRYKVDFTFDKYRDDYCLISIRSLYRRPSMGMGGLGS